jgi:hypothetical protein
MHGECECFHGAGCRALKEAERKTPGFQRLRMAQYDGLRKKLISSHGTRALKGEVRLLQFLKKRLHHADYRLKCTTKIPADNTSSTGAPDATLLSSLRCNRCAIGWARCMAVLKLHGGSWCVVGAIGLGCFVY